MLKVVNLVKTYKSKKADTVYALNDVSIDFPETGLVFLLGKSGSGKSTLLNAIGGLDVFDSGEIIIKGKSSKNFSQSDFDSYRNTFIGFIFQEYNILENFTVAKNLALALELQGKKAHKKDVDALLEQVDMKQYANRKPNQLSGGQKQRVAIARALIKNPEIIMADEPTGALDSNTGRQVMETLKNLSKSKLVIIVSHDREFAEIYGDRIIELKDGKIIQDVTKKELETKQTESGIKIIGDDVLYIKRGQEISDSEAYTLAKMIKKRTVNSDMFISFDDKANKKLKEGAKINDDGNKEAFVDTTPTDIVQKDYNGKDLKLIKSHLKFSDSFKMGASSLKTKVGKLIFTILLSFFAFTVFGLVDTFSTWNRATSVYEGIKYDNQKVVMFQKEKKEPEYTSSRMVYNSDLTALSEMFKGYEFNPVYSAKTYMYGGESNMSVGGIELNRSSNPVWNFIYSGILAVDEDTLQSMGFSLEGRLPQTDNEIAISKHLWEVVKKMSKTDVASWSGMALGIDNFYDSIGNMKQLSVVGIVDDKSDLSKYENISQEQLQKDYDLISSISASLTGGASNFIYLTKENAVSVDKSVSSFGANMFANDIALHYQMLSTCKNLADLIDGIFDTASDAVARYISYYKNGKENIVGDDGNFVTLNDGDVLVPDYILSGVDNYENLIDEGNLKLRFCEDYDGKDVVLTLNVVGTLQNENCFVGSTGTISKIDSLRGYSRFFTVLGGNNDEALIKYCETFNSKNIRYTVQNSATKIFDNFEGIITSVSKIFLYVAIVFAVFASLLLMNFISASVSAKKREIGVLRALGARGSDIYGIFFNESSIVAFINFVLSAIATFAGCFIINSVVIKKIGISIVLLSFSIRQLLLILAISWGSAIISSFIPSFKISRKRPIDAINNR